MRKTMTITILAALLFCFFAEVNADTSTVLERHGLSMATETSYKIKPACFEVLYDDESPRPGRLEILTPDNEITVRLKTFTHSEDVETGDDVWNATWTHMGEFEFKYYFADGEKTGGGLKLNGDEPDIALGSMKDFIMLSKPNTDSKWTQRSFFDKDESDIYFELSVEKEDLSEGVFKYDEAMRCLSISLKWSVSTKFYVRRSKTVFDNENTVSFRSVGWLIPRNTTQEHLHKPNPTSNRYSADWKEYYSEYLPLEDAELLFDAQKPQQQVIIMGNSVIRVAPDTSAAVLAYTPASDSIYEYLDLTGNWYHVVLEDGKEGYVYTSRCTVITDP